MVTQQRREELEKAFWRESESERPGANSLDALTNKMAEGRVLLEKIEMYADLFRNANTIVEIGGGQGWSSCLVARLNPSATVIPSDISPEALQSMPEWERILKVRLPGSFACRSYQLPLRDSSVDLLFAFAAAHHFGRHRSTFRELRRVLRPGGKAVYMHEPASREFSYKATVAHVNRKRPVVREDVLRLPRLVELAAECGLDADVRRVPTTTYRGALETVYFLGLSTLPQLQRFLPCSVDIIFTKLTQAV